MTSTLVTLQSHRIRAAMKIHMNRIKALLNNFLILLACLGLVSCSTTSEQSTRTKSRPNVIVILTDDQGWGDVGFNGNPDIDTPNLDSLASDGVVFDRFYVNPICSPTRAALLTGRVASSTGVFGVTRTFETMRSNEITIAEVFQKNGYATGIFGKWHNGAHYPNDPLGQGFDEFLGFKAGHITLYDDPVLSDHKAQVQTKGYVTDTLMDATIDFVIRNKDGSFFAYVPLNAPHSPLIVPDELYSKYAARGFGPFVASTYGMVENIDWNIGRLLNSLETLDLTDKTIVVFLSDNGPVQNKKEPWRYNGGMAGHKGKFTEGGVRVPFVVRWPGKIDGGRLVKANASHYDLLPTLANLTGLKFEVDAKRPLAGRNIAALMLNPNAEKTWVNERPIFLHHHVKVKKRKPGLANQNFGLLRQGRWSLVKSNKKVELYDIQTDPGQEFPLNDERPDKFNELNRVFGTMLKKHVTEPFEIAAAELGQGPRSVVHLPAHEAFLEGTGVQYEASRNGWSNDWVSGWSDENANIYWNIEVKEPGQYELEMSYAVSKENVGGMFTIGVNDQRIEVNLDKAALAKENVSKRRSPTPTEAIDLNWPQKVIGSLSLQPGQYQLRIEPIRIVGKELVDIKQISIRYKEPTL